MPGRCYWRRKPPGPFDHRGPFAPQLPYYAGKPFYNFFISTSFSTFFISTFFGGFAPLPGANPAPSGLGLPPVALASAVIIKSFYYHRARPKNMPMGTFWAQFGHKSVPMGTFFCWAHFGHILGTFCSQNVPRMCPKCARGHIWAHFRGFSVKMCPKCAHLQKCAQMCPVAVDKITILHPMVAFWAHFGHKFWTFAKCAHCFLFCAQFCNFNAKITLKDELLKW